MRLKQKLITNCYLFHMRKIINNRMKILKALHNIVIYEPLIFFLTYLILGVFTGFNYEFKNHANETIQQLYWLTLYLLIITFFVLILSVILLLLRIVLKNKVRKECFFIIFEFIIFFIIFFSSFYCF